MAAERTLRRPKHPRAYAAVIALAAAVLAAGVAGTWRLAQHLEQTPAPDLRAEGPRP